MSIIQGTTKVSAGGYTIDQSIRFNDDDSAYMSFVSGTPTDQKKGTWSFWVKRGNLGITTQMFNYSTAVGNNTGVFFDTSNRLNVIINNGSGEQFTSQVFRDISAWYHIVVAIDTTQATGANRTRIYINGSEYSGSYDRNTIITQNTNVGGFAASQTWFMGRLGYSAVQYFDGYLAESHFIDGQQLASTDFGEYNDDGVWVPKAYAGTYGNNGFYITGEDSADLGADYSGNGNDFTSSGLTSDDQVTDTPTENFATMNPNNKAANAVLADGNLQGNGVTSGYTYAASTLTLGTSGKWFFTGSMTNAAQSANLMWGIQQADTAFVGVSLPFGYYANAAGMLGDGRFYGLSTSQLFASGVNIYTKNAWLLAVDVDGGKAWWGYVDTGTAYWFNSTGGTTGNPATGANPTLTFAAGTEYYFASSYYPGSYYLYHNFGQLSGFDTYQPTGFKALSTANLPEPTIKDGSAYFQTTLYTGTGSTLEVNQSENSTFQPDLVWVKQRNKTDNNVLTDAVRGAPAALYSNSTAAEVVGTGGIESLDTDGFTLGTWNNVNQSGITAAAWQWLAGNGTASNTDGTITSTVSANQTAGFSVLTYSGSGITNDTVGHGLGVKPSVVIVKPRNAVDNWIVNDWSGDYANKLKLNASDSTSSAANFVNAASSTTFTLGSDINVNGSGRTFVAYCWNEVEGFSKFGKYTGNGSADGPFVWCGFRPAFILVKEYTSADDWLIYDSSRDPYNVAGRVLRPDSTATEFDGRGGSRDVDFLSNGFKFRSSNATMNGSGAGYIFMAFAEHPFGGSGVAPVPAR